MPCTARRGRRCPLEAHAGAVGLGGRLHCDARARVVPQNSLRSLRSLRSDIRGKSVHEARCRAPTPALRFSSPQKSPPAGCACRDDHPWFSKGVPEQEEVRLRGAEKHRSRGRAQRASLPDSSRLSERRERSERSEFCDGAARPSIAGKSAPRADRRGEAPPPARARLCRAEASALGSSARRRPVERLPRRLAFQVVGVEALHVREHRLRQLAAAFLVGAAGP